MTVLLRPWSLLLDLLAWLLKSANAVFAAIPMTRAWSWGLAIVALTFLLRSLLLPVAIKQVRFTRKMKELKPLVAEIKERNQYDAALLRSDWREYKTRWSSKDKQEMALYRVHGVNPAVGCLPMFLQPPLFIAAFRVMTDQTRVPELAEGSFLFLHDLTTSALRTGSSSPWPWVLVGLVGLTTFSAQYQNLKRGPTTASGWGRVVLLAVLPTLIVVLASIFPPGPVIMMLSMNLWMIGQQQFMFRRTDPEPVHSTPPQVAEG